MAETIVFNELDFYTAKFGEDTREIIKAALQRIFDMELKAKSHDVDIPMFNSPAFPIDRYSFIKNAIFVSEKK